jgi:hypothetical protein
MKRQPWGLYAIALAILIVGLVALGVPASTLLFVALILACPLMMLFMMRGMHGGGTTAHHNPPTNAPGQRPEDEIHHHDTGRR